jgi:DNA repair exonuclease SbcCD ATPase subunit
MAETTPNQQQKEEKNSSRVIVVILIAMIVVLGATGAFLTMKYMGSLKTIDALEADRNEWQQKVTDREAELDSIKQELAVLTRDGVIPQATVDSLNVIIADLQDDLEKAKKNRVVVNGGGTSKRISELEAELSNWQQKYTMLEAERNKLSDDNKKLTGDMTAINQQNQELNMRNKDLQNKVDLASTLKVMGATLTGYRLKKNGDKLYEEKVKKMSGMEIQFSIVENAVAQAGDRTAYIVITGPNRKVLAESTANTFRYMEMDKVYSTKKEFYFNSKEVEMTADFKTAERMATGEYRAEIFIDGALAGYCTAEFK